jgi:signal transduction histidine kinase
MAIRDAEQQSAAIGETIGLLRVALLVARDAPLDEVFTAVAGQAARRLDAAASVLLRFVGDERAVVVGAWRDGGSRGFPVNAEVDFDRRNSAIGRVRVTGRPARADSYEDSRGELAIAMRAVGLRASVAAPVPVAGQLWGALVVSTERNDPLPADDEGRIADLADLAGRAVERAAAAEQAAMAARQLVEAADAERRRLESSLHDDLQQHVLALSLRLRVARGRAEGELGTLLDEAIADTLALNDELREFAREIYPSVLTERGLAAAVQAAATRARLPVHLRELPRRRYAELTEATAYFVVVGALAAAAAAEDGDAEVAVADAAHGVIAEVRHPALAGTDVAGLRARVVAAGGRLSRDGDVLRAELPG